MHWIAGDPEGERDVRLERYESPQVLGADCRRVRRELNRPDGPARMPGEHADLRVRVSGIEDALPAQPVPLAGLLDEAVPLPRSARLAQAPRGAKPFRSVQPGLVR